MTFEDSFLASPWAFLDWLMMHLEGLGICGMAVAAFLALSEYKKRVRFKHEFDAAKRTLHAFYELRVATKEVRNKPHFPHENRDLESLPKKGDLEHRMKTHPEAGVKLLRMDNRKNYVWSIRKLEPEFRALLEKEKPSSNEETSPFQDALEVWSGMWKEAVELVETDDQNASKEKVMSWSDNENDPITKKMNEIVQKIEDICLPVLRGDKRP